MIAEVRLFEMLKAKIGAQEAEAFIELMDTRIEKKFEEKKDLLATKVDISQLEVKIQMFKIELIKWMIGTAIGLLAAMTTIMKFLIDNALHH